ncbi:MAG: zinc ribbon domain-containing protein, partial [Luteolibacter sp.]
DEKRKRLEADRADVSSEREKLSADVPEDTLPLYERLLKTKAGLAVAPVEQGKCGGCHMKLITSTVVAVQSGRELTRCENCGRFLYLSE